MKAYRLKHIPSGLYYSPNKGTGNLTSVDKLYIRVPNKPSYVYIYIWASKLTNKVKALYNAFPIKSAFVEGEYNLIRESHPVNPQDWLIEEID